MSVNQQDSKHEIGAFTELELGMLPEVTELARHLSMTTNLSSAAGTSDHCRRYNRDVRNLG